MDEQGAEFLAFDPAGSIAVDQIAKTLPRAGARLVRGDPFTILAVGDSVTATGPYPEILAKLLARSTGNSNVRVVRAAYPGKGVDAAVRRWERDGAPAKADLTLIMFGLNDQASGSSEHAYREQIRWLVDRAHETGGDVVLLEPTPHISLPPDAAAEASVFRVAGFAAGLRELGEELGVPVAATFDALWGTGKTTVGESARAMRPLFPTHYSKPFSSLVETDDAGDTIHPNAAGHLRLARAVFDAISGREAGESLQLAAVSEWADDGRLVAKLTLVNRGDRSQSGRLAVYPYINDDRNTVFDYALRPGERKTLELAWPDVESAEDLLHGPAGLVFGGVTPRLQVIDIRPEGSRVRAIPAPLTPEAGWVRERRIVQAGAVVARLREADGKIGEIAVTMPETPEAGHVLRVPLGGSVNLGVPEGRVAGEAFVLRHAEARSGEATADARLDEWAGARWAALEGTVQSSEHAGFRAEWAFRAGEAGVWVALRAVGATTADGFALLFDPRVPEKLGTAGPYTWVEGKFGGQGRLTLRPGDSSPPDSARGLAGAWVASDDGSLIGEFFVPYPVLGISAWPESGDLGLSIAWTRSVAGADGARRVSRLYWSADRYPWNTLEFGVVRRDPSGPPSFVLRVR